MHRINYQSSFRPKIVNVIQLLLKFIGQRPKTINIDLCQTYYYCEVEIKSSKLIKHTNRSLSSPFIFSFKVKLPWIFFSSASIVNPPMSASRWVRFTMPIPNTMSVTCWGSELTRLRRRPLAPRGLLGVAGSCCSFSNITLQNGSEGRRPPSAEKRWRKKDVY